MMRNASPEEAIAVTSVFWDVKRFPVPHGFDARRVRPCIKQLLEKYGYCGPLTIYAVGILTNFHDDILRDPSSTGINLYYAPFGCSSLMTLMFRWICANPSPANILAICDPLAYPEPKIGYNLFGPFSFSSPRKNAISWISLILAESSELEEDTCSETDEPASWFCQICKHHSGQDFKSYTSHLSSLQHVQARLAYMPCGSFKYRDISREEDMNPPTMVRKQPEMATREEAVAVTSVFWDINRFPVPPGFDASRVSLCIKLFLEKYGFSGPLTITAVGNLSRIPDHIFQALTSTGITLCHSISRISLGPPGSTDIMSLMSLWISEISPPANILGICDPRGFPPPQRGYNIFRPFSYSSPQQDAFLWESLILAGAPEEATCSEAGETASWFCVICKHLRGQGFGSFIKHLSSRQHALKRMDLRRGLGKEPKRKWKKLRT